MDLSTKPRYLQRQYSYSIKNDNYIKFLLAHIRKMQNTAEVKASEIHKTASLTEVVVDRKRPDVSVRKV